MTNIAIFASGGGSNARKIMEYFEHSERIRVGLIVSNKREAGVLNIASEYDIPTLLIDRQLFYESETVLDTLRKHEINFVVLAGFLWLIPAYLVRAFPKKIVNIHPALLPKYGGKGMYGHKVHEAVKAAGERESGMTIHFVNEHYDEGDIIFQGTCSIDENDSTDDIARKVLNLEHHYFPKTIEALINTNTDSNQRINK